VTALGIAHAALWVAIGGLGALVVALSRQVAALHGWVGPAGALAVNAVLAVGQAAPRMRVETLAGRPLDVANGGRSQLLLFVAPDCPISRSLTPVLGTLKRTEPWLDVVLVSDGEADESHRSFAASRDLAGLDYVLSEALGRACGVSKVPYAVLIDESARVAAMGIVNSREHLESLFESKEQGIESIQAFMAASAPHPGLYHAAGSPADADSVQR
jgi:methylamine dehydrogenase accessory protein MauD